MALEPITTSPKSLSHLQVVIARLRNRSTELQDAIFLSDSETDANLIVGDVVYAPTADHVDKARADVMSTSHVIGISTTVVASGAKARIQTCGVISIPGASFTTDAIYYLSESTAGTLTTTPTTTPGETIVAVAIALSAEELRLLSVPPILL